MVRIVFLCIYEPSEAGIYEVLESSVVGKGSGSTAFSSYHLKGMCFDL
jgi:hypothetical protein